MRSSEWEEFMRRHGGIWALEIVLALFFITSISCSKLGKGGDSGDDGNSPFMIGDLRVASFSDSTIQLKWTATGDDSSAGTANHYDIRYFRNWVNWATWDSATQVIGEPAPSPAGQTDSTTVTNLMRDSTYYFAIMAYDEAGNGSGMSNCAQGLCITDFIVTFSDPRLAARVRTLIHKPTGDILRSDLMTLSLLDDNGDSVTVLNGVEYCTHLDALFLSMNQISDLTQISGLTRLRSIQFGGNHISDISPISNLVNLIGVVFRQNSISNISALSNLVNLTYLDISQNNFADSTGGITALSGLLNLHMLYLVEDHISDIHPLVSNTGLAAGDTVYLDGNPPFSQAAIDDSIALVARGVAVYH
jgi:hypothetical protein